MIQPSSDAITIGALVSTIYVMGEVLKGGLFSKRRKEESDSFKCKLNDFDSGWLDKYECQFEGQRDKMEHILSNQERKEMMLKILIELSEKNERKFERVMDKFDNLTNEIHQNNLILRQFMSEFEKFEDHFNHRKA